MSLVFDDVLLSIFIVLRSIEELCQLLTNHGNDSLQILVVGKYILPYEQQSIQHFLLLVYHRQSLLALARLIKLGVVVHVRNHLLVGLEANFQRFWQKDQTKVGVQHYFIVQILVHIPLKVVV
jgi:hypothetical protein